MTSIPAGGEAGRALGSALVGGSLLAAGLTGCATSAASEDTAAVTVVTSTSVYADLASSIGGSDVSVTALVASAGQDPHSYEGDARDLLAVSRADVVIKNGGGYDDFMDRFLDSVGDNDEAPSVITAVDAAAPAESADGAANEHVWYDVAAMRRLCAEIAATLGRADAAHADDYKTRARDMSTELAALEQREFQLEKQFAGTAVGITEPIPLYLLEAVGLRDITPAAFTQAVEEGEDVPVSVLDDTLDLYREHQVAALVYNEQTTSATTEQVKQAADDAGIPVVAVTETLPAGSTYRSWMSANLDALAKALAA